MSTPSLPWGLPHLALRIPLPTTTSCPSLPENWSIGPSAHQHLPRNIPGVMDRQRGYPYATKTWQLEVCVWGLLVGPSAGTLGSPPPFTYLWLCYRAQDMKDRRGETRRARKGRARGLRLSLWQIRVIFLLFPLFLCKKCRKAGQLFARSVLFPEGRGKEGPRPVNPVWD